jgi:hypothetical protein
MTMGPAMITRGANHATVSGRLRLSAIIWVALLVTLPVHSVEARAAQSGKAAERVVAECIARSAAGRGWLEKTLWGLRDQEGGWAGAEIPNSDGSYDLGPLQVNSWWVPRIASATGRSNVQIRHWLVYDSCFNIEAARWIFLSGLAVTRDYWKAIGVYHSPTGWRQRRYTGSVIAHLKRRFGKEIFQSEQ